MDSLIDKTFNMAVEYFKNGEDGKAYEVFEKLAKEKDTDAQIRLGYMLFLGSSKIKKNIDKASYWFKIAEKESSEAERMLGFCCLEKGDIKKGILHLKNAFSRKNTIAIVDLGDIYDFGKYEVAEDKNKALYYYTEGCKKNNHEGCKNLISLLSELKIDKYKYIKNNIGTREFILIFFKNIFTSLVNR